MIHGPFELGWPTPISRGLRTEIYGDTVCLLSRAALTVCFVSLGSAAVSPAGLPCGRVTSRRKLASRLGLTRKTGTSIHIHANFFSKSKDVYFWKQGCAPHADGTYGSRKLTGRLLECRGSRHPSHSTCSSTFSAVLGDRDVQLSTTREEPRQTPSSPATGSAGRFSEIRSLVLPLTSGRVVRTEFTLAAGRVQPWAAASGGGPPRHSSS